MLFRLLCAAICVTCVSALWTVAEDLPLSETKVVYNAHLQAWQVSFHGASVFSLAIPQLCTAASPSQCKSKQFSNAPRSCSELYDIFNDTTWVNTNLQEDLLTPHVCPVTFKDLNEAQNLYGSALPEPLVYVTSPLGLRIYNSPLLRPYMYSRSNSSTMYVSVRVLLLTYFKWAYGFHEVVIDVMLKELQNPQVATASVENVCRTQGFLVPADGRLEVQKTEKGALACVAVCPPDKIKTPWNMAPSMTEASECVALPTLFTAVEFGFSLLTEMLNTDPTRLTQEFYDGLDELALSLGLKLGEGAQVAMTIPASIYDVGNFENLVNSHITSAYHPKLLADTKNESLVLEALQQAGLYDRIENTQFVHSVLRRQSQRRSINEITVKGLLVLQNTEFQVNDLVKLLRDALTIQTYAWNPELRIVSIADVDIQRLHRASAPVHVTLPSQTLQHNAMILLFIMISSMIAVSLMMTFCKVAKKPSYKDRNLL